MEALKRLSREAQIVFGGTVLFVIVSFFDWQQVSVGPFTVGKSLWHGFGVLTALVAIVLLAWEASRAFGFKIELGSLTPGTISAGLSLLLALFTLITFLDWSQFRHWPEWIGLVLGVLIGASGVVRARNEGVAMPAIPKNISVGGSGTAGASPPPPTAPSDEAPTPFTPES
jgi:hypothetical protein